jgi:hypothetical protein
MPIASDTSDTKVSFLQVFGTAELDGPLAVERLNDFMPAPDDTFDFLSYKNRIGEFSRIENKDFGDMHWEVCCDDVKGKAFLMAVGPGTGGCPTGTEGCP